MLIYYLSLVEDAESKSKIELIYTEFYSYMTFKAGTVLSNEADVEDAVHNAMLKIIGIIDEIDMSNPNRAKTLCGVIARHEAINMSKLMDNQTFELYTTDAIAEADVSPDDVVVREDDLRILVSSIKKLDKRYRDVFTMKFLLDLKEKEIGEILEMPASTVATRLSRG
ncbi:MAG: sigma-70 family RNA polymerase sigma factor, partial [Clostridia bacterium]|nr:sigma-70 family RNA polymerase sigma factor [Clostridia bacterium]